MTGVNTYSVTASNNVEATTQIDWDEGMSPGQVNNSARQNMADLRTAFNDLVWFRYGKGDGPDTVVYASSTSTTIAGADVTAVYHAGRRIKAVGSGTGTIYGAIASSSYSTGITTVNYTWDSGSLSNETLTVYLSQLPVTGTPVPANGLGKSDLKTIQGLSPSNDDLLQRKSGAWTNRTSTQVAADLQGLFTLVSGAQTRSDFGQSAFLTGQTVTLSRFAVGEGFIGLLFLNAGIFANTGECGLWLVTGIGSTEKRVTAILANGNYSIDASSGSIAVTNVSGGNRTMYVALLALH